MVTRISVIIPAFNEGKTLANIVAKVQKADICGLEKEIIIVDNNSTDDTLKIALQLSETYPTIKTFSEEKRGKGAAVKRGIRESSGSIITIQDADLEYDPRDLDNVIRPIINGDASVVNGVRIDDRHPDDWYIYFMGWLGNHAITMITNLLYDHNAKEYEGCYKAFLKSTIESIEVKTNNFDFDNELICKLLKKGVKPLDVPIHYYPRNYKEGKKINWRHGFKILWTIIKYRFID